VKKKRLICIGDSHASFFAGQDIIQPEYPEPSINSIQYLEGVRLGAVLAYSLHKEKTTNSGREKLFEIISGLNSNECSILFCFGEIDCRYHILKIAENTRLEFRKVVESTVEKYFGVIKEVRNLGFEVIVWNVIPSSDGSDNVEFPSFGTQVQRNYCTNVFNGFLEHKCLEADIEFVNIYNKLVTRNLKTKEYYLFDGVHLGQIAMPYFVQKINQKYPHIYIEKFNYFNWKIEIVKSSLKCRLIKIKSWAREKLN
jgi:hypothetical protein